MYKKMLFTIITAFMLNACAQTTPQEDSKQFYFCVEMDLGQDFPINPQIKGAIKSLDGVMSVEEI